MNEINCNVIQDILPLYIDGVVSEDTKVLVEAHLKECESCRHYAESMRQEVKIPTSIELKKEQAAAFRNLKKKLKTRKFRVSVVSVLLTVVLIVGTYCALTIPEWCIPYDSGHIKVYEEDGVVYAEYEGIEIAGSLWAQKEDMDYEGKTHQIFCFKANGWSKFIEPILNQINPPDEKERKFIIGNADEIEAVYYGKFSMMHKPLSFKTPEEEIAEMEKQKKEVLTSEPVWSE